MDLHGNIPTFISIPDGKVHDVNILGEIDSAGGRRSLRNGSSLHRFRAALPLHAKWIKQHLRIKAVYGTGENAVKTQMWIAVFVYVLVAILRKRLGLEISLYQIPQILSVKLFEKTPGLFCPFAGCRAYSAASFWSIFRTLSTPAN